MSHRHPKLAEVRLAATLGSFGHLPMHLASALGYFQEEGVEVTIAEMSGSSKIMQAIGRECRRRSRVFGAINPDGCGRQIYSNLPNVAMVVQKIHPRTSVLFDPSDRDSFEKLFGVARYPSHVLYARLDWIERNRQTVRRLTKAVVRALRYIDANSPEVIASKVPAGYRSPDIAFDVEAFETLERHVLSRWCYTRQEL